MPVDAVSPEISQTIEFDKIDQPWKSSPDEPYSIRRFNPNRPQDSEIFTDIDRHPIVLDNMEQDEPSSPEVIDYLLRIDEADREDPRALYAITEDKTGEPVGFVQYYTDPEHPLPDGVRRSLRVDDNTLVLTVSFAKNFKEWPAGLKFISQRTNLDQKDHKGVAVSGLRQTLKLIKHKEEIISKHMEKAPRSIIIYAFTDPENPPSEAVLEKNSFSRLDKKHDYNGDELNLWIKKL